MRISEIIKATEAEAVTPFSDDRNIERGFSSDLMSDVLTLDEDDIVLITGLANIQLIRTSEMADIGVVLLARGKKATPEMIALATENNLVILETPYSIFRASGELYSKGLKPVY